MDETWIEVLGIPEDKVKTLVTIIKELSPDAKIKKGFLGYCIECGIKFEKQDRDRLYCDRKCAERRRKRKYRTGNPESDVPYRIDGYIRVCEYCLKKFKSKHAGTRYCSMQCNQRDLKRKKKNRKLREEMLGGDNSKEEAIQS